MDNIDCRLISNKDKNNIVKKIIEKLDLKPLQPEGGYFKEIYRSGETIKKNNMDKCLCTSILYLITSDSYSMLHRVFSDEIYHFYFGDPVTMLNIELPGEITEITLGSNIMAGQRVQHIVASGFWQGCFLKAGGVFALMGTTMSPGFDYREYESGIIKQNEFIEIFPEYKKEIMKLTREK